MVLVVGPVTHLLVLERESHYSPQSLYVLTKLQILLPRRHLPLRRRHRRVGSRQHIPLSRLLHLRRFLGCLWRHTHPLLQRRRRLRDRRWILQLLRNVPHLHGCTVFSLHDRCTTNERLPGRHPLRLRAGFPLLGRELL